MPIKTTTITVKQSFCPECTFKVDLFSGMNEPRLSVEHVKYVLCRWADITGMNFSKMPKVDHSQDPGNEGYRVIEVENPIDNRGKVTFVWEM